MATIYLHIGAPKTATSSIQSALVQARPALLERGVLYPDSCRQGDAHHVLVCDLIDKYQASPMPAVWYGDYPRGQAWASLAAELEEYGDRIHSAILSSELFFGQSRRLPRMLDDILAALPGHEFKVLLYLRPQDQLYSSFYNQDVKGARQWPGTAYEFYETHQLFHRDYHAVCRIWAQAFGEENLMVRPYEPSQWREGNMLADFCDAIGVPGLTLQVGQEPNEGLGMNQLYIKRCLNQVGFPKEWNDRVMFLLLQLCEEPRSANTLYVNRRLYSRLCKGWERANRRVAQDFLGRETLFERDFPSADDLTPHVLDREMLAAYLAALDAVLRKGEHEDLRPLFARGGLLVAAEQQLWDALSRESITRLVDWSRDGN